MRITGGRARGIRLECPSQHTRPATDAMREALGSSLASAIPDARVLDLFAGSGAYGLELLSRGAAQVSFVEKNARCTRLLMSNIQAVCKSLGRDPAACTRLMTADALILFKKPQSEQPCDLVIADPPYPLLDKLMPTIQSSAHRLITPSGHFLLETPADYDLPTMGGLQCVRTLGKARGQSPQLHIFTQT